ncbi:hypothetical protein EMIT0P100_150097 [Pseudomonas sp. IT-P100]
MDLKSAEYLGFTVCSEAFETDKSAIVKQIPRVCSPGLPSRFGLWTGSPKTKASSSHITGMSPVN